MIDIDDVVDNADCRRQLHEHMRAPLPSRGLAPCSDQHTVGFDRAAPFNDKGSADLQHSAGNGATELLATSNEQLELHGEREAQQQDTSCVENEADPQPARFEHEDLFRVCEVPEDRPTLPNLSVPPTVGQASLVTHAQSVLPIARPWEGLPIPFAESETVHYFSMCCTGRCGGSVKSTTGPTSPPRKQLLRL